MSRPAWEIADVFRRYDSDFQEQYARLTPLHLLVLKALALCRTAALGGHLMECDHCGHQKPAYNSCHNRHCPKCQAGLRAEWFEDRQQDLLPVEYFHVVFTLPSTLGSLALQNKALIYNLLFQATAQTLLTAAAIGRAASQDRVLRDSAALGAEARCPSPSALRGSRRWTFAGWNTLGELSSRILSTREDAQPIISWQVPGAADTALSARVGGLCQAAMEWPQQVLKYLARYTHRVAIANQRLASIDNGQVTFRYKDCRQGHRQRTLTLAATEFIRRFLMHVLPNGFMRIRYYGFLANTHRQKQLAKIRELLGVPSPELQ